MASAPKTTIATLQAGRAAAAAAVLLLHAEQFVAAGGGGTPEPLAIVMRHGYLGVDFFFVLSGFIIYHVGADAAGQSGWAGRFAAARLSRIFVPYLPVGVGLALAYTMLPRLDPAWYEWGWLSTLTLLPIGPPPALPVAWTLQHELVFYALMLLLLRLRMVAAGLAAWAALIALHRFAVGGETILFATLNLEFIFGVAAAAACRRGWALPAAATAGLAAGGLAACFWLGAREGFGLCLAVLLLPLVRAELAGRLAVGRIWLHLGAASYALYLVHYPVLRGAGRVMIAIGAGWLPALVLLVAIGLAAGLLYHFLFEAPALRRIRSLIAARRAARGDAAAGRTDDA